MLDLQWRGRRLFPVHSGRCPAVLPQWCPPQVAPREVWPWWRNGDEAVQEINVVHYNTIKTCSVSRIQGNAQGDRQFCERTHWFIIFLKVAAFANQAELILRLLLFWCRAGGSVHQCAGSCVGSRQTLWVSPGRSRSSLGPPRCPSGLKRFR